MSGNCVANKILVVDADSGIRELLFDSLPELFSNIGISISIVLATNGREALKHFKDSELRPGIVITGIEMPLINGWQLTKTIKKEHSSVPVIVMSGSPEPADHQADAFISKPFKSMEGFAETIRMLLATQAS